MGNDISKLQRHPTTKSLESSSSTKSRSSGSSQTSTSRFNSNDNKHTIKPSSKNHSSFRDSDGRKNPFGKFNWKDRVDEDAARFVQLTETMEGRTVLLHDPLKIALEGNIKSPVEEQLRMGGRILDVGTSSGTWGMEVAKEYDRSQVYGMDVTDELLAIGVKRLGRPHNFHFVEGNILERLPFPDKYFNFVFCRLMALTIPKNMWSSVIAELVRVLKPGGYIEMIEGDFQVCSSGPIFHSFWDQLAIALEHANVETCPGRTISQKLESKPELIFVTSDYISLPVGWNGSVGEIMKKIIKDLLIQLAKVGVMDRFELPIDSFTDLAQRVVEEECPEYKSFANIYWAYAQRSKLS